MFFHVHQCEVPSNIVIQTDDTDCFVKALGCKHNLDARVSIWLEIGKESRNDQRYININQLHQHLGAKICCTLPAYHAFTGCDYTFSFMKKGKVNPFKLLQKNESVQDALIALGEINSLEQDDTEVLENYVCQLYGLKNNSDVSDVRMHLFFQKYQQKEDTERLIFVKKYDGSLLPRCRRVLKEKIKRTQLVARKWILSVDAHPPNDDPEGFGWLLGDHKFHVKWYDGETTPKLLDIILEDDNDDISAEIQEESEGTNSNLYHY